MLNYQWTTSNPTEFLAYNWKILRKIFPLFSSSLEPIIQWLSNIVRCEAWWTCARNIFLCKNLCTISMLHFSVPKKCFLFIPLFFSATAEKMRFMCDVLCVILRPSHYSLSHPSDSSIIIKINVIEGRSQKSFITKEMMKRFDFNTCWGLSWSRRQKISKKFMKKKKIYNSINRAKIINS